MNEHYVIGIGAANVDINGKSINPLIMKDSNPGNMNISVGGVTRNVMENLSLIGYPVKMISVTGNDNFGSFIREHSNKVGIDMTYSLITDQRATSTYLAILDNNGDMLLALSDMNIIKSLTIDYLEKQKDVISNSDIIVIDPCLSQNEQLIPYICETYGESKAIFCDPVSCGYALKIKPYLQYIHTIKPNEMELQILSDYPCKSLEQKKKACEVLINKGVKRVFVSLGADGCLYYDHTGCCIQKAFNKVEMVNATGAGDAFMAAIVYCYVNNLDINTTLDYALASGIIALSSKTTINPEMSLDKIKDIIKEERGRR